MALEPGLMLGPYEIEGTAGQGGMGEVYRARDTRLDRKVAIKVLPADVAGRADRRARFEREARAIAALNHPNICSLFDVGTHEGNTYLVLEFVEGETLAQAIARQDRSRSRGEKSGVSSGSPSVTRSGIGRIERVYEIAIQIAEALDAAHRQGFIHRDLKPANVMLTRDGVKLLDFGLAKSIASRDTSTDHTAAAGPSGADTEGQNLEESGLASFSTSRDNQLKSGSSRTASLAGLTMPETVMGTLRYAAPEQIQGKKVDRRADIFSFGAVLYEMLTGKKAFAGQSDVSLIAAILEHDPRPPSQYRADIPAPLERLVLECLAKNSDDRWQSAGDVSRQLRALAAVREQERKTTQKFSGLRARPRWFFFVSAAIGAALCATFFLLTPRSPQRVVATAPPALLRVSVQAPGMVVPPRMALSPDGRQLAFIGRATPTSPTSIFIRPMDAMMPIPVAGSEGASELFWSPSGTELGFYANLRIMRVGITAGSTPRIVESEGTHIHGASWGSSGVIVFSVLEGRLRKVSVGGTNLGFVFNDGVPRRYPKFLPGGTHIVYKRWEGDVDENDIAVYKSGLDGNDEQRLESLENTPLVDASGRGLLQTSGGLLAQQFDLTRFLAVGEPVRLLDGLETMDRDAFTISSEGTLAYLPARSRADELVWVDRKGQFLARHATGLRNYSFSLSRDEKQILLSATGITNTARSCYRLDLRTNKIEVVAEEGPSIRLDDPIWAPDGKSFVYVAHRTPSVLLRRNIATGVDESLIALKEGVVLVEDWSDDGKTLVTFVMAYPEPPHIMLLPLDKRSKPETITPVTKNFDEIDLSPDGQLLAYENLRNPDSEIVLQARNGQGKVVHLAHGLQPRFAADGKSIYYLSFDGAMMQIPVPDPIDGPISPPTLLFQTGLNHLSNAVDQYRVGASGDRFLLMRPVMEESQHVQIVRPWYSLLDTRP